MELIIRSAQIVDPSSPWDGETADIHIRDGRILEIGEGLEGADQARTVKREGVHVSPGWFDMRANLCDPGYEYKEDIESGTNAAARGGFTDLAAMPSTSPPVDNKGAVDYLLGKAHPTPVDLWPVGALSRGLEGQDLAEMYDMYQAGAIAFSEDKGNRANEGLMLNALLYVMNFGSLVIAFPEEPSLADRGVMHEGVMSTRLGLKGIPEIAEEMRISRDLYLLEYAEGRIHFSTLSTARSVELLREARDRGQQVTADIAAHQLAFDDAALAEYDTNLKVRPPFRSKGAIDALKLGLKEGVIDVICSDHTPEDIEHKKVEFGNASYGIIGLETAFAVANTHLRDVLSLRDLIGKMTHRPRSILGIPPITVKEGQWAKLTLFDPEKEWRFDRQQVASRSANTPFDGYTFRGKPLGIVNKDRVVIKDSE